MKELFPPQQEAHDFFVPNLLSGRSTLDSSYMGTGKTVVGARTARTILAKSDRIKNVAVICPKAVSPTWKRELEECGIEPLFILNIEKLRLGKTGWLAKRGKKHFTWNPLTCPRKETLFLVDEIHQLKGPWTQNAAVLIALIRQGYVVHGMSGTPCESPIEMRPLGYMLRLHNNDRSSPCGSLPSYFSWLHSLRCEEGYFGGYEMTDPEFALTELRKAMYGVTTKGLTVKDFPDSFRANRVIVDPIEFKNNKKIVREYSKLNLSAEDVRAYIEDGTMPEKGEEEDELTIVKIGRAREMCEMYKIADIASMTNEAMDEGYNVAIFLNYTESIEELTALLDCKAIYGATHPDDRDEYIEQFQNDEAHCLVLNSATGGTGISLHDVQGKRPRLSLISPSFNAKEFSQVIGRIHRNGAKSDALQKVLLAHDSIEEYVMTAINRKLQNMKLIHDSEPCKLTSTHY